MVIPCALAASANPAMVDARTRRLSVVVASSASADTCAGGWCGAVLVAIARLSAGEGRRDLRGNLMYYAPTSLRKDVGIHFSLRNSASKPAISAAAEPVEGTRPE